MTFTPTQLRLLTFVARHRDAHGVSPTYQEMADAFGVTKISVYDTVERLERKGALRRTKYQSRSIELLAPVPAPITGRASLKWVVDKLEREIENGALDQWAVGTLHACMDALRRVLEKSFPEPKKGEVNHGKAQRRRTNLGRRIARHGVIGHATVGPSEGAARPT